MATLKSVTENAADLARDAQESVQEFAHAAGQKFEAVRTGTGGALHAAASSVRRGSAAIDGFATGAADRLDASASSIERWTMQNTLASIGNFGRNHLSSCLVAAAAIGFFAGSALGGSRRSRRVVSERT